MLASFCRISDDNIRECINYIPDDYVDVYMLHTFTDCHNFFNFHLDIFFLFSHLKLTFFSSFEAFLPEMIQEDVICLWTTDI
jgi:hypothetical protein